jgi:hypothetical protein
MPAGRTMDADHTHVRYDTGETVRENFTSCIHGCETHGTKIFRRERRTAMIRGTFNLRYAIYLTHGHRVLSKIYEAVYLYRHFFLQTQTGKTNQLPRTSKPTCALVRVRI